MISVLHIYPDAQTGGGIHDVARRLDDALAGAGIDVRSCPVPSANPGIAPGGGLEKGIRDYFAERARDSNATDVVHIELGRNAPFLSLIAYVYTRAPGITTWITVHDPPQLFRTIAAAVYPRLSRSNRLRHYLDRRLRRDICRRAGGVIVHTETGGGIVHKECGAGAHEIHTVPLISPVPAGLAYERPAPEQPVRVIFLGLPSPAKGIDILMDAWPTFRSTEHGAQAELVIAGGYPEGEADHGVEAHSGTDGVRVTGYLPEERLWEELTHADMAVFPARASAWVPASSALLWAMQAGCAIIATEVNAFPECVTHGETGVMIPPEDAGALVQALGRLARDRSACTRMGEAARTYATTRHAPDAVGRLIADLYAQSGGKVAT